MPRRTTQSAALLLLLAAAGAAGCGQELDPMGPVASEPSDPGAEPQFLTAGSGPRILFSSARSGGTDIYRMAPDGTGLVRITSFAGPELMPAWSWNNARIAMVRDRTDPVNGTHKDIYLMNADGTGKKWARSFTTAFDLTNPTWSKDGTRIALSAWIGADRNSVIGTPYLGMMTVATGNAVLVSSGGAAVVAYAPSFDPTGTKVVYTGKLGESLETINADGSGHVTLIGTSRGGAFPAGNIGAPAWSPDGKRIAFAMYALSNWDIYVLNLTDFSFKRLTTHSAKDINPTWSADGTRIAFTSTRSGQSQVWTVPSNGGTQVRVTKTSVQEQWPAWSH